MISINDGGYQRVRLRPSDKLFDPRNPDTICMLHLRGIPKIFQLRQL